MQLSERLEEYRALRATIRERGTARLIVALVTFVAWAGLLLVVGAFISIPAFSLVPLLVLAAGFEAVFAAHVGVERIGRYLQVFHEPGSPVSPCWELLAMAGSPKPRPSARLDPLFAGLFAAATLLNLIPVVLLTAGVDERLPGGLSLELAVYSLLHFLFLWRLVAAWRFASHQRKHDLEHFVAVRDAASSRR